MTKEQAHALLKLIAELAQVIYNTSPPVTVEDLAAQVPVDLNGKVEATAKF